MLRPLDIVVLLKLSLEDGDRAPYLKLANELCVYPSEVYSAVKRARISGLVHGPELGDRLNRSALLEFLVHGLRYVFPAELGGPTRGIPTAYAAPPLVNAIHAAEDLPPVWPYAEGPVRGIAFAPLHKNVPRAALADARLYELLALTDTLREGRARERKLAVTELERRIARSSEASADA